MSALPVLGGSVLDRTWNSDQWCDITGARVLDADGWDRRNFAASWSEPITVREFVQRLDRSTSWSSEALDIIRALIREADEAKRSLNSIIEGS